MKNHQKTLLASCATGAVVIAALAYQSLSLAGNVNAFDQSLSTLRAETLEEVNRLVRAESAGMARNEEGGVVYYHSQSRTGEKNRVYLLWAIAPRGSRARSVAAGALAGDTLPAPDALGIVAYVDLGFHSFRTRYDMMLARMFRDRGPAGIRGACYRWDPRLSSWHHAGELSNGVLLSLLTPSQKKAALRGTYNAVCVLR